MINEGRPRRVSDCRPCHDGDSEAIVDIGASGTYVLDFPGGSPSWRFLTGISPIEALAVGDLDDDGRDDKIFGFGPSGVWVHYNDAEWVFLTGLTPELLVVAELDGSP